MTKFKMLLLLSLILTLSAIVFAKTRPRNERLSKFNSASEIRSSNEQKMGFHIFVPSNLPNGYHANLEKSWIIQKTLYYPIIGPNPANIASGFEVAETLEPITSAPDLESPDLLWAVTSTSNGMSCYERQSDNSARILRFTRERVNIEITAFDKTDCNTLVQIGTSME